MNKNATAIILIILSAGIYLTFTQTKLDEVTAVRKVNTEYLAAMDDADKLLKERDKVRDAYNNIALDDRQKLDKMIPNTVDNIRLIIDLNSLALDQFGFSLRNIKATAATAATPTVAPTPPASQRSSTAAAPRDTGISNPTLDTVTVSFSLSAQYQDFIDFMQALESNLRIMDLTRLTVSPAADASGKYEFGVELKTYWLRQ